MSKGKSNTLLAFLLGGVAGAAIALLFAPATGKETREKIREGMDEAGEWTKDRLEDAKDSMDSGADRVRDIMEGRKEDLRAAYKAGKDVFQKRREGFSRKKEG
ncbi:MAG: YtxH domain-containing protein [Thermodesulfobacteriota bacterium]